jgi:polysaccharide export outer membrane protein
VARTCLALACAAQLGLAGCAEAPRTPIAPVVNTNGSTIGPGDTFEVAVYGEADLSGKYRVATDGSINFPLVGRIEVAGMNSADIGAAIEGALRTRELLKNPTVSVFLLEQASKQISVVGAVVKPGSYGILPGMTIVQAISAAGGLTPIASGNETIVTRRVDGSLKRFTVPVSAISEGREDDFPLQAGDIVFVPERIF